MAKKAPAPAKRVRKLGERTETEFVDIPHAEVSDAKDRTHAILHKLDQLREEKKAAMGSFKARADDLNAQLSTSRATAGGARREVEFQVEEWLTSANEVIRIRADTGEQLGARTASAREMQEELPLDDEPMEVVDMPPADAEVVTGDDPDEDGAGDFGAH
jgi:hypothetical protein